MITCQYCKFAGIFSPELSLKCQEKVLIVPALIRGSRLLAQFDTNFFFLLKLFGMKWSHSIRCLYDNPMAEKSIEYCMTLAFSYRARKCKH